MNTYEQYIALSRYARFIEQEGRRETWEETVYRYIEYFKEKNPSIALPWGTLKDGIVGRV